MKLKLKKKKLSIFGNLLILFIILMICSGWLSLNINEMFSYTDEICVIIILIVSIIKLTQHKLKFELIDLKILILYFIFIAIGLIGNYKSSFQTVSFAIMLDIFSWSKLILVYVLISAILIKDHIINIYLKIINLSKVFLIITTFLAVINQSFHLKFAGTGYSRFGLEAFALPGNHPTYIVAILACIISLLCVEYNKNYFWIILSLIICCDTLRFKAIGYCIIMTFALFFMKDKIKKNVLIAAIISMLVVCGNNISNYFGSIETSRGIAMYTSFKIAKKFFPTGSGFGTFGTMASGKFYSKAYNIYKLSNRWGFRIDNYGYISDGGWATQIGQFGLLGTLLFICILFQILKEILKLSINKKNILPSIALITYLIIASSAECPFNSDYSVIYGITLAIIRLIYKQSKTN